MTPIKPKSPKRTRSQGARGRGGGPRLMTRALAWWLAFAAFVCLCWVTCCSAPTGLDPAELECVTVDVCPCHYDVVYPAVMLCDLRSGDVCTTDACFPDHATLYCPRDVTVTLDVTGQEATLECPAGTQTVPVRARFER
jgi:hypothetical protein